MVVGYPSFARVSVGSKMRDEGSCFHGPSDRDFHGRGNRTLVSWVLQVDNPVNLGAFTVPDSSVMFARNAKRSSSFYFP